MVIEQGVPVVHIPRELQVMQFESLLGLLRETVWTVIRKDLPPNKRWSDLWESAERLAWIGLTQEQESFFIAYSFGTLKDPDPFVKDNQGTDRFDYLEQQRINVDHYPDLDIAQLRDIFSDLLPGSLAPAAGEDADEEDLDDLRDEMVRMAVLVALGICSIELMEQAEKLPMPVRPDFSVSVSGDRETPTWPASVPTVDDSWPASREAMVSALCASDNSRKLLLEILHRGDEDDELDLLVALRDVLERLGLSASLQLGRHAIAATSSRLPSRRTPD